MEARILAVVDGHSACCACPRVGWLVMLPSHHLFQVQDQDAIIHARILGIEVTPSSQVDM
jgi:hypothetical protein